MGKIWKEYVKLIEKNPPLSQDEERELLKKVKAWDDAKAKSDAKPKANSKPKAKVRAKATAKKYAKKEDAYKKIEEAGKKAQEKLVLSNLRNAIKKSNEYKNGKDSLDHEEILQEELAGLVVATSKFKLECDNRFMTYAEHWAKKMALTAINETASPIHIPENKINEVKFNFTSLDAPIANTGDEKAKTLVDTLKDNSPSVEKTVEDRELKKRINEALNRLTEKESYVLRTRFGLWYDEEDENQIDGTKYGIEKSLRKVAAELSTIEGKQISGENIRLIEKKALEKLRKDTELKKLIDGFWESPSF